MVGFLIKRPVAVIMTFLALLLLGIVASNKLPVSLMPDIEIPEITVAVSRPDVSARELENTVVSILRRNLLQVPGLDKIESESRNGSALIRLTFKFGNDINLAFMEVNEKVDGALNNLPRDLERPRIIKASATDIPVFMLNLTLADSLAGDEKFMELSSFAETVIKKRIEQLPEIAMADITGQIKREIYIDPDEKKMLSLGISDNDITNAVQINNITIGSILVKDGKYLYNLEFSSYLKELDDVRNIYIKAGNRILQIRDIADVGIRQERPRGLYYSNGKRAIALAIIKESTSKMASLEEKMTEMIEIFRTDYPQLEFEISQNQTRLLDYSLSNLKQSLLAGGILAFLLMFFFLKDGKSPMIIGFSIPATLVISLLFFYLVGLSINIISLAGLILGIGMMIDNSIVVIENITQWIDRGLSLPDACVKGTNEIITPLISSVLVTCAVFIPLIFLSGISGALFYDQAIAIVIGQGVSLFVGITLLPTIYYLLYRNGKEGLLTRFVKKISLKHLEDRYEGGMNFFFRYRTATMVSFGVIILVMIWFLVTMEKEKFPAVRQDELVVSVDWNENIDVHENLTRNMRMLEANGNMVTQSNSFIGEQQFLFNRDYDQSYTQSKIYIKAGSYSQRETIQKNCYRFIRENYPNALVNIAAQQNIFEKIFEASETPLVAEVSLMKEKEVPPVETMTGITDKMRERWPDAGISYPPLEDKIHLKIEPDRLMLYNIDPSTLYTTLKTSLNQNSIGDLRASYELLPIVLSDREKQVSEIISSGDVLSRTGQYIPVKEVVSIKHVYDYKTIKGGMNGEYVPVNMNIETNKPSAVTSEIRNIVTADQSLMVGFSGSLITGQRLFRELAIILVVALLLLYFILAAQFESLTQPLIVLLEIPIDIAGALLLVKLWGGTINIITMIGLIVMSGVIINDSILKVDTINNLRAEGLGLKEAIYTGGARRLKPIIMVAMASLLSTAPILFSHGMGSELQRPMALALIGGMSLGTVVSLFFIPLAYWYIYRKSK
ncbi:MAG TPA: efflux RND transporter permease subunit [Bacteroidales bacterium]|nr:efflux RND transporter permease subunit [Bacteroidales bacterium]HPI69021.1 efflux RND transporter permease subunit [Bacteroidales bacterium]HPR73624.1 efflux RND transporter permease subunit [Bacteroidales bacterium]HRW86337.1 efflux RND transporter permease subunit [Bacteroidales bacterium]